MKKIILGILTIFVFLTNNSTASEVEVVIKGEHMSELMVESGFTVKTTRTGYLREGENESFSITLYSGNTYAFMGYGDKHISDLDVKIYDEDWELVKEDKKSDEDTFIGFTPKWSGKFYVVTTAYIGSGYWGQVIGWF